MLQRIAWLLLALVHLLPALALFSPTLITKLYGVERASATFPLLQHRAALFLAVVILCLGAAIDPGVRHAAALLTTISMVSFLLLYWLAGAPPALRTIAVADLIALPALAYILFAWWRGG